MPVFFQRGFKLIESVRVSCLLMFNNLMVVVRLALAFVMDVRIIAETAILEERNTYSMVQLQVRVHFI